MSPVFRHGRLRLYLLKLLDEAPRHGYEVIRLLQDRFLGVYAPSPGTIYPRLARLEEEGLVTHDEVAGKKVYRITEKGREEIRGRFDDLAELEEELAESVRDIAREVTEDVRETVRNLREELTWVARDVRRDGRAADRAQARTAGAPAGGDTASPAGPDGQEAAAQAHGGAARAPEEPAQDQAAQDQAAQGQAAQDEAAQGQAAQDEAAQDDADDHGRRARDEARRVREEARRAREDMRDRFRAQRGGGRREWADWAAWQSWPGWAGWHERPEGPGDPDGPDGPADDHARGGGWGGPRDAGFFRDLERMAIDFARELRVAAGHAEHLGENGLGDLWGILEDALTRIRDEVFGGMPGWPGDESGENSEDGERGGPGR